MHDLVEKAVAGADVASLVREVFTGPLAALGFEPREGQIRLSETVGRSIDAGGWALAEAPCGSGKGAAYLVPGILGVLQARARWEEVKRQAKAAGQDPPPPPQMVITTANISLQRQLIHKDIPAICRALGVDDVVDAVLLKGRNNYLCRDQLETQAQVHMQADAQRSEVERLLAWSQQTKTGDREDLPFQVSGKAWSACSVMARDCAGKDCRFYPVSTEHRCFAEIARDGYKRAHILVCNHHLLTVLPKPFPNVVLLAVDEAHELEEAIRSTQGMEIRETHAAHHGKRIGKYVNRLAEVCQKRVEELHAEMVAAWQRGADRNTTEIELSPGWMEGSREIDREYLAPLLQASLAIAQEVEGMRARGEREEAGRAYRYAKQLAAFYGKCVSILECEPFEDLQGADLDAPWAFWLEKDHRGRVKACAAPADVAGSVWWLQRCYPRAVLTSATLATAGSFGPMRLSYGLEEPGRPAAEDADGYQLSGPGPREELVLPSPYPLEQMGVCVVPDGPSPKEREWRAWAAEQAVAAIAQAQGRTLVLCTSNASVRAITERARTELPHLPIRAQGEAGRSELQEWFAAEDAHTLVASRSFFQGIDVQGEALSCVVIDRLPFAVPDHPLERAVCKLLMDRAGKGSGFTLRSLPEACKALAQASGRLIRSQTDRGALVILDGRLRWRNHTGRTLRKAIPPFPLSREIEDVGRMLRGENLGRTVRRAVPVTGRSLRRGGRRKIRSRTRDE